MKLFGISFIFMLCFLNHFNMSSIKLKTIINTNLVKNSSNELSLSIIKTFFDIMDHIGNLKQFNISKQLLDKLKRDLYKIANGLNIEDSELAKDPSSYFKTIYDKNKFKDINNNDVNVNQLNQSFLSGLNEIKGNIKVIFKSISDIAMKKDTLTVAEEQPNKESKEVNCNGNDDPLESENGVDSEFLDNFKNMKLISKMDYNQALDKLNELQTKQSNNNFRFIESKSKYQNKGSEDSDPPEMYESDVLCKNAGECLAKKLKWNK